VPTFFPTFSVLPPLLPCSFAPNFKKPIFAPQFTKAFNEKQTGKLDEKIE